MSGLVNGVLAGTGAFLRFATAMTTERRVATEGFFWPLRKNETDPTASWNGFGGVWHSRRGLQDAGLVGEGTES
jgi:hypothetical protein